MVLGLSGRCDAFLEELLDGGGEGTDIFRGMQPVGIRTRRQMRATARAGRTGRAIRQVPDRKVVVPIRCAQVSEDLSIQCWRVRHRRRHGRKNPRLLSPGTAGAGRGMSTCIEARSGCNRAKFRTDRRRPLGSGTRATLRSP